MVSVNYEKKAFCSTKSSTFTSSAEIRKTTLTHLV